MRNRNPNNLLKLLSERLILSFGSALIGAIANVIVAPLAPPIQDLEVKLWLLLAQNWEGLKHWPWLWIGLLVSLPLLYVVILLLFMVAWIRSSLARKHGHFPSDWRRQPNPYAGLRTLSKRGHISGPPPSP